MANSGNWIPNLINWIIGYIIFYIWLIIFPFANLLMMWQLPLDGALGIYESNAASLDVSGYDSMMSIGNGGTSGTALI